MVTLSEDFFASGALISKSPHEILVAWGQPETSASSEIGAPAFYFPDFFLEHPRPWRFYKHTAFIHPADLLKWIAKFPCTQQKAFPWVNHFKDIYKQQFFYLQSLFEKNVLEKAVPYIYEACQASMTPHLLRHILKNALEYLQTRAGYIYGHWDESEGILGVTPELLFQYDLANQMKLSSHALAGTYFQDGELNLDQKLQHEHQVVVKDIVNALLPFGKVFTNPIELVNYANIRHLLTKVEVALQQAPHFMDVVKALHPTSALGAYPKAEGLNWLKQYQTLIPRRSYGAPAGYLSHQQAGCYVAIRNLQWTPEKFIISAGGGIVKESQLEEEQEEIDSKIASIKSVFKI